MNKILLITLTLLILIGSAFTKSEGQTVNATADPLEVCHEGDSQLDVIIDNLPDTLSINWTPPDNLTNPSIPNPIAQNLTSTTTFIVTVTSSFKVDYLDSVEVIVFEPFQIGAISGPFDTLCFGDNVTLTATPLPQGGSGSYVITWFDDEGDTVEQGNNVTIPNLIENTGFYYIVRDELCGEDTTETFQVNVYNEIIANNITGGPDLQPICNGDDGETLTAYPEGGSGNDTILWYVNNVMVAGGHEYDVGLLYQTTEFKYALYDSICEEEVYSTTFSIVVYDTLKADDPTGTLTQVCSGQEGGTLTAHPDGGSEIYTSITWYDDEDTLAGYDMTFSVGILNETTGFYYIVEDEKCGYDTSNVYSIEVFDLDSADVIIEVNQNTICSGEEVIFSIDTIIAGGSSAAIEWRLNGGEIVGTDTVYISNDLLNGDKIDLKLTSSLDCVVENPVYSNEIVIEVLNAPDPEFITPIPKPRPENGIPAILICADSGHIYEWYKNNEVISGANRQFYYPGDYAFIEPEMDYSVKVKYQSGCENMSETFSYTATKSKWFNQNEIAVFPNPNKGQFYLMLNEDIFTGSSDSYTIRIIDINGMEVLKKEMNGMYNKINMDSINKGVYFLEIRVAQNKEIHKIIIY